MISTGEILVILGAAGLLIGPKELPGLARGAGRLTGRAAAFLTRSRAAFLKFSDENEITELHKEMQQSLAQLQQIQYELRSGINVLDPGPLARKAMTLSQQQAASPSSRAAARVPSSTSAAASLRPAAALAASEAPAEEVMLQQHDTLEGRASAIESLQHEVERLQHLEQRRAQLQSASAGNEADWTSSQAADTQPVMTAAGMSSQNGSTASNAQTSSNPGQGMGISAVSLGKAPDRSKEPPTGSDIALDALAEEEVANAVRKILEQHSKPP
ncbi:hypothetical protein CVIRNUC_008611 [Coccomyxa viridis]|uniref:Sec-independent protein translocase protein TatB n=1 Tax=Coccomyxa viridis TaxID=1274662 RepID=A0AAV1IDZ9_9CHLO|nr:hypothetical protein CVIRNUC_008611 [Coccomyxa viridis]